MSNEKKGDLALPTPQHVQWADCEIGVLIHCDIEIFQPDWEFIVNGKVMPPPAPKIFNPSSLDTDQWIAAAKAAGARYVVLTAKHVTGFTLFPDPEYDYSIMNTPYKGGKGDIVAEFIDSCRKHGLRPGLYYSCEANAHMGINKSSGNLPAYPSPEWDAFKELVTRQLSIIWSRYGELFEIWFDGGVLEHGPDYAGLLRRFQPRSICFQGPYQHLSNIRWIGNERGEAPYPCWSTTSLKNHDFDGTEETSELGIGSPDGNTWMPAETDVPIRYKNWFWKPFGDYMVAPPELMLDWYYKSVGHNSNLLLGVVIDDQGLVPEADVQALQAFGDLIRQRFASPIAETQGDGNEVVLSLPAPAEVNHVVLMEDITKGHRVRGYVIEGLVPGGSWVPLARGSSIGHKRIEIFEPVVVEKVRFIATRRVGNPSIRNMAAFCLTPVNLDDI
nr:alpha-L-fucosidase [Candidatus Sigynarchaeota archaeon]